MGCLPFFSFRLPLQLLPPRNLQDMRHWTQAILRSHSSFIFAFVGLTTAFLILFSSGCDIREVIEVERPFFEDPPEAALGFLGYDEEDEKLTVCGNCHVGQQSSWTATSHADAWVTLENSGHAQAFCENCHAVSANGNPATEAVGWTATQGTRYHDVQCESCHGLGEVHVSNPDIDASHPIASLAVGDLSDISNATGCADCHQGTHHPFAEEWAQSGHANVISFAAERETCAGCHRGQGVLDAWGVSDSYVEKDAEEHLPITCGVCHDPHDASIEGQLRRPIQTSSVEQHLCASCHNRRTVPDPNSSHGLSPHSPQTALLLGDAGWFPPESQIDQGAIIPTHGSDSNAKLCATCHVNSFTITDEATGDFVFNATGHLFTATPCLDDQGIPTPGDCDITATARSFAGCTTSGCHSSQESAAQALANTSSRLQQRAEQLIAVLSIVDSNLEEAGGEIDPADPTFTVAEGAFFNYNLAVFGNDTRGASAHNPYLTEALLIASLQTVLDTYSVNTSALPYTRQELDNDLKAILNKAQY